MNFTVVSPIAEPSIPESSCHSPKGDVQEHAWLVKETSASTVTTHDHSVHGSPERRAVARKRLTVSLPLELLERSRNTVYWTQGLTLAGLLEEALTASLDHREELNGQPFPTRLEGLKGGRPRNSCR